MKTETLSGVSLWPIRFKVWAGEPVKDTYGGKAVLDLDGEPVFAELAILRLLEKEGYEGAWVDSYRHRFRNSLLSNSCELPEHAHNLLDLIIRANDGHRQGCWDVFAWKNGGYLFVESKRKGKDRMRPSQLRWLDAAMRAGLEPSCFCICEWDIEPNN